MAIIYGTATAIKSVTIPYPFSFILESRGNGSETTLLSINPFVNCILKVTGAARFYTDVDGTLGEATSKNISYSVDIVTGKQIGRAHV